MLIGVLIMLVIIAGISITLLSKSTQEAIIVTETKQGYATYQSADGIAEAFINNLRRLDGGVTPAWWAVGDNIIPENFVIDPVGCDWYMLYSGSGSVCYTDVEGINPIPNSGKYLSDVLSIKSPASSGDNRRAIHVPLPNRAQNLVPSITITNCTVDCNGGDTTIQWDKPADLSDVDGFEIRISNTAISDIHDSTVGWTRKATVGKDAGGNLINGTTAPCLSFVGGAGPIKCVVDDPAYPGGHSYFTLKTKNDKNFELDSLYLSPVQGSF